MDGLDRDFSFNDDAEKGNAIVPDKDIDEL